MGLPTDTHRLQEKQAKCVCFTRFHFWHPKYNNDLLNLIHWPYTMSLRRNDKVSFDKNGS